MSKFRSQASATGSGPVTDRLILLGTKGGPALREPGPSFLPTSMLLVLGEKRLVLDCGIGVSQAIARSGEPLTAISDIFISHFHSDHYLELGGLIHTMWVSGRNAPITIHAPKGIEAVWAGFLSMMAADIAIRIDDEGRPDLAAMVRLNIVEEGLVMAEDGLRVEALRNGHPPLDESYALSVACGDRRFVFSGDTAPFPPLAGFAHGADLLVHEAMLEKGVRYILARTGHADDRLEQHIRRSHTPVAEAAKIAAAAGVGHLVLNHLLPPERSIAPDEDWLAEAAPHFSGTITVGCDGLVIPL